MLSIVPKIYILQPGMLTRPDILKPEGRERGPNSVQKYHGPKTTTNNTQFVDSNSQTQQYNALD